MSHEAIALWTEMSSDPELIAGVRAGDAAAFGVLYERHVDAARRVAAVYTNTPADVDDVVSEAFSRVLRALQQGDGPDLAFRAYLFTIVRRTGMDLINKGIRTKPREDMGEYESAMGFGAASDEMTLDGFEHSLVADAFKSLPERWQAVLWYTEVEKKSPREVAPLLGLSANGVAALSYRAREALRQAYLQQHLNSSDDVSCLEVNAQLGAYVRGGLNKREATKVSGHVTLCERCSALVSELEDVNRGMRAIVGPLVLGAAASALLDAGLPVGGVFASGLGAGAAGAAGGTGAGVSATALSGGGAGAGAGVGVGVSAGAVAGAAGAATAVGLVASSAHAVAAQSTGHAAAAVPGGAVPGGASPGAAVPGTAPAAAGAGAGAGGAGASASAGVGAAAGAAAGGAGILVPVAAVTGVLALGIAGAGYLGLFSPAPETSQAEPTPPAATEPALGEPTVDDGPSSPPPDQPIASPQPALPAIPGDGGAGDPQGPAVRPGDGGDGQPGVQPGGTPAPTRPTEPAPEPGTSPDPTTDPSPEPTTEPGAEPEPTPEPTTDPEPTPTTPPARSFTLSVPTFALGYVEVPRTNPTVPLKVSVAGEDPADGVVAQIALPDGLTFAPPPGGSGRLSRMSERVHDYMAFVLTGQIEIDDWTCTYNDDRDIATCEIDELVPGDFATALPVLVGVPDNADLAVDATTRYTVEAGDQRVSYEVRTGVTASEENFDDVYTGEGRLGVAHVGGSVMGCPSAGQVSGTPCANVMSFAGNGAENKYNNNAWAMLPLNTAGGERNSGTTTVSLPEGAVVKYAAIEWSANRTTADRFFDGDIETARVRVPGGDYVTVSADATTTSTDNEGRIYYQSRTEITELVAAAGSGTYSVADIALAASRASGANGNYYGGFAITIVYEHESLPQSRVAFFDGSDWVMTSNSPDFTFFTDGPATVTLGFVAWDGDRGTVGDQVRIGTGTGGGTALTPWGWNGTAVVDQGDSGNAASSTAFGSPFANTLGTDAKLFKPLSVGAGKHVLLMTTTGDNYLVGTFTVTIVE